MSHLPNDDSNFAMGTSKTQKWFFFGKANWFRQKIKVSVIKFDLSYKRF